ncbi:hypothetical protein DW159_06930 [Coprococcus sp. AM14-16]|uniref:hypothetical protein n=1 Tax=Coprococcus TaxID=33042 RepID=UPI000E429E41|nr:MULTISPECIES: hypothetical protein [Coprococcus]RGD39778.1 hypothetical protein DW159_06930 [Coprococcus sp. AM14-16]RHR65797.1 hypothetical protein DWW70_05765 [Coprococcus sp. AF16-5]RJV46003.1 hypothetical protein DWX57_05495 [Coprococcus sp. AF19-8AC]
MEFGFCSLYGKGDRGISNFFKEANNKDVLGLRPMNNRISEILFPECTTLMPNLVYIYYLNAIYHVLKEKGSEDDVDYYERMISHHIVEKHREECKGKGFFDDAKDRAYKKYKNKMKMLHYLDEKYSINGVCLLDILKETDRYKFVKNVIDNVEVGSDVEDLTDYEKDYIYSPGKLDEIEKLDYIRRVLMPDDDRICRYSYTSNIIASFLAPVSNKKDVLREDSVSKLYKEGKEGKFKYEKLEDLLEELKIKPKSKYLYEFEKIDKYDKYGESIVGKDNGFYMYEYLRQSQIYSIIQYIAKLSYKWLLFSRDDDKRKSYEEKIRSEIAVYFEISTEIKEEKIENYWKKKYEDCKSFISQGEDGDLGECWDFINKLTIELEKDINTSDIEKIASIVEEREKHVQGAASKLGTNLRNIEDTEDYIDTFRWEYRPTESQNRYPGTITMCVSYYISELFYNYIKWE